MTNRDKVREWVFKQQAKKRVKGFMPQAIVKELDVDIDEVKQYCRELIKEDVLEFQYLYLCECGFNNIYETFEDIHKICDWCEEEVDMSRVCIEYILKR